MNRSLILFCVLFGVLAASRLSHLRVLWAEETLPLAAAGEMRAGKVLYRDIWFDKPPVAALVAWTAGGSDGPFLRVLGALYGLLCCALAWGFARDLWGNAPALWAAALMGFFLIFDFPAAVIPLASDLLMLAPHLAALWMARRGRPVLAGTLAGVAFAVSPKGALVLLACLLWVRPLPLAIGFVSFTAASLALLGFTGALHDYWQEVWRWGSVYAGRTFLEHPLRDGIVRTANWAGFHLALIAGAVFGLKDDRRRWLLWIAIALLGAAAGLRFFPRYYLILIPPLVLLAARGFATMPRPAIWAGLLLLVPAIRFTPTYVEAARGGWRDTAMDAESRAVGLMLRQKARPGDTLFVWGYRPEIYVYSGLHAATRYLDSQPLTGVPADRHLTQSAPVETIDSKMRRQELAETRPAWIVDGLGLYNPNLALAAFPELRPWLARYREAGRSGNTTLWELANP